MRRSGAAGSILLLLTATVVAALALPGGEGNAWGTTAYNGTLRPTHNTSLCLDAPNPSGVWPSTSYPSNGTALSVYSCHGNPNQDWTAERITNELYRIRSSWSNQCLEIAPSGGNDSLTVGLGLTVRTCVLPASNYRRQTFVLTRIGTPSNNRYQIRPAISNPYPDNSGAINCLDVVGSGGSGSTVVQYRCDSSVGQSNQVWQFEFAPEWTGGSGDGERPNAGSSSSRTGAFREMEGIDPFCSGGAINGYSGNPDFVLSVAHCFVLLTDSSGNITSPFNYRRRYDTRVSPPCQGTHYVDRVYYALGSTSLPQDTAFVRTGGSYSCANGAWVGQRVNAGGQFTFKHGNLVTGDWMYSTGYPSAFTGNGKVPFSCANPVRSLTLTYEFQLDCEGGGGISGSVWARWGTLDAYAASNRVNLQFGQYWCDTPGCTYVTIPIIQQHYWHTFDTKTRWESVT